ncbi:DUF4339 domain-containing protein [bacterium]|nr:DUF4339 domain-containing protein [bacterium]
MFSFQDQNHQVVGPVATDEIRRLITAGAVTRHTLVRRQGTDFWQPAEKFEEFANSFPAAAQPTDASSPAASPDHPIDVAAEVSPESPGGASTNAAKSESTADNKRENGTASGPRSQARQSTESSSRFFMIGGDGREYGPVEASQIREWIRERRADGATKLRREDGKEFGPLSGWPEFADEFGGSTKTDTPPQPPLLDSAKAEQIASEIIGKGINISVGACFTRAWNLYTAHFGILTGTTALVLIILSLLHSVPAAGSVIGVALGGVLVAGLSVVFLKTLRGQKAEVNDLFLGFNRNFVPLLLASVLVFILVSAGLLLCVLPGIYLAVAWMFVYTLIFERSIDFWPAMELSRKVVHERWWELFALALGASLLVALGLMLAVVGVFFTTPIAFAALMYAYEDIFGDEKS